MHAVESVLDIASMGGNTGLISSATILPNESYYGSVLLDTDYDMGVLSLAVSSGKATPYNFAANLYEQVMFLYMSGACVLPTCPVNRHKLLSTSQ